MYGLVAFGPGWYGFASRWRTTTCRLYVMLLSRSCWAGAPPFGVRYVIPYCGVATAPTLGARIALFHRALVAAFALLVGLNSNVCGPALALVPAASRVGPT